MTRRFSGARRVLFALPLALMTVVLLSGQAEAFTYIHQTGLVGPWSFDDNSTTPGVVCNYGATLDNNHYFMKNLVVQPPTVYAADRNSAKIDTRKVSWQFQIQRKNYPNGKWKVAGNSAVQKGTATDNAAAMFSALKLKHIAVASSSPNMLIRVQVTIKWYKPNGSVEGTIVFRPSYYTLNSPDFHVTSGEPWCQEDQTSG